MNKTAIVFGATGLVGKELVFELLESPDYLKVIAVVRRKLTISHSKLEQVVMENFDKLEPLHEKLKADEYYCCIGTTIKTAGSQEAFRKVDFDIPVNIAKLAMKLAVPNLVIISSVGANALSNNFYLRTKGEMENTVKEIFQGNLKIVRPSLLMGHRSEFRFGEKAGVIFMKVFGWLLLGPLAKFKGIYAWDVARAMIKALSLPNSEVFIESDKLHTLALQDAKKHNPHEIIK